jgi:hypothetical protein
MAEHDYVIANQNGANTRSDLNNALAAIVSNNSKASAPTTTYAFMWWADTANDILKQRNAADSAWISILTLSTGAPLATIANFTSTGIDDNATSTAITIDASENVGIGATTLEDKLNLEQPYVASGEMAISFSQSNYANRASKIIHKMDATGNGGSLILATNANGGDATERMRIDSAGDVNVKTGNLVIGTSGKGIDFSAATPDGSGTTGSEVLDDYEEGTFTPTLADASGNTIAGSQSGYYTKVGRNVTFEINLSVGSHSGTTGANDAQVNGLPFAVAATIYSPHTTSAGSMASDVGRGVIFQIFPSTSYGKFYGNNWNTSSHVSVKIQDFGTAGFVRISGTYIAT